MLNVKKIASVAAVAAICVSAPAVAGDASKFREKADEEKTETLKPLETKNVDGKFAALEPVNEPQALIIRTYLSCSENQWGFEVCDTIVVACDDEDPGFCTSTN